MSGKRKYRINELLENLPLKKSRQAVQILPGLLGVSFATLNNYRRMNIDDPNDIPHEKVVMLEQFFGVNPGELQNFTKNVRPLSQLADTDTDTDITPTLPETYGLTKS